MKYEIIQSLFFNSLTCSVVCCPQVWQFSATYLICWCTTLLSSRATGNLWLGSFKYVLKNKWIIYDIFMDYCMSSRWHNSNMCPFCEPLNELLTLFPLVPSGKSRPTFHVMVSSLLVPPPPPTSEGATTGTTMRQQKQDSEPTYWESTSNANPHRL